MTKKLYDADAYLRQFTACVTGCEPVKGGYALELDQTAFFPEGGGQPADTGTIGPALVSDVQEKNGRILHIADRALPAGERFSCAIDWEQRYRRMQNHSGEHTFSGLAHRRYGLDNVGFHMSGGCMTIDFSIELSREQLQELEREANEAVRSNVPIRTWYPDPEELASLDYRSKKELEGAVRLVEVSGIDLCACCAPHVKSTGEIGCIKVLSAERHRGGVRIELVCGMDALDDYRRKQESVARISALLSVPRDRIAPAVERLLENQDRQKERIAALSLELARLRAETTPPAEGNLCVFDNILDEVALRELANLLMERCGGIAGVFSGSDEEGYRYIIGSRHVDLRAGSREINEAIRGRGGGSVTMIQGRSGASENEIRSCFQEREF